MLHAAPEIKSHNNLTHVGVVVRMCKHFRAKLEGRTWSGVLPKNVLLSCFFRNHEFWRLVIKLLRFPFIDLYFLYFVYYFGGKMSRYLNNAHYSLLFPCALPMLPRRRIPGEQYTHVTAVH